MILKTIARHSGFDGRTDMLIVSNGLIVDDFRAVVNDGQPTRRATFQRIVNAGCGT